MTNKLVVVSLTLALLAFMVAWIDSKTDSLESALSGRVVFELQDVDVVSQGLTLDFQEGFTLTESPTGEGNVGLEIVEANLKAVDVAGDEECLTYEATGGDFEWQACGGAGAQNLFETIDAPAGTDPVADSATDTLQLLTSAGTLTITGNSGADSLDFDIADNSILEVHLKAVDEAGDEECLTYESTVGDFEWQACGSGVGHAILDGAVHTDSVADGVTRGSLIYGNSTPKWDELVVGGADTFLRTDGTDVAWSTITLGTNTIGNYAAGDGEAGNATGLVCTDCVDGTDLADTITLDANLQIDTGTYGVIFQINNPSSEGVEINGTGAFTSDLLHVHQHTGNPTGGNALHVEATDPDINPILYLGSLDTDFTAELVSFYISAVDDDDTDWIPLRIQDDSGGTPDTIFEIGWNGAVTAINVTSGEDPGHTHTGFSISGLDFSDDLNLVCGTHITCSGDTINVDDVFILIAGDTVTGTLTFDDGVGASPQLTFNPQTGTSWSLFVEDTTDDLQIESNTSSTESVDIINSGAGVANLTVEGTISGTNVTSGENPGHTHTGTSISGLDIGDDTNLAGGRSLSASGDGLDADPELYTDTKCIWFEDPTASDDFKSFWRNSTGNDLTLTELWAESDQTVTFMLQVDDGSPADVDSVDLAPAAGEAEDTSLDGDTTLAQSEELDLAITSVSGAPTWVSICWTFTWND